MKWLKKNKSYCVYIFYENEKDLKKFQHNHIRQAIHEKKFIETELPCLKFLDISFYLKPVEKFREVKRFKSGGAFSLSYRTMCEFWTSKIFDIPEVQNLQSYLR
jgi:hypothetical protein